MATTSTEYQEQKTVVKWCEVMACRYAGLDLIYHIPNEGKRGLQAAAMLKAAGLKRGVPDLCLPVPRGCRHGLYIEMKRKGGRVQPEQAEWIKRLNALGYCACVCYGADEAIKAIETYYMQ